ncbi:MAG: hypothetical protein QGH94_14120, partial [Phycisphaerae bacterium]|nr:hypothetical protein [Phycisphaerae bacterium]
MARVVRRRKNPLLPVLLIFVFLFLIASVMAVLSYNKGQDDDKGRKAALAARRKIISDSEMTKGQIKQILIEKEKDRDAPTVVAELSRRIDELSDKITGAKTTASSAIQQLEAVIGQDTFVLNAIKSSRDANSSKVTEIAALTEKINTLQTAKDDAAAAYKALEDTFTAKAAELAEEVRKVSGEKTALIGTHTQAMKDNNAKWQAQVTQQAQEINTRMAQVSELKVTIDKQNIRIGIITDLLRVKKETTSQDLAIREAGKIKEVMPDRDVCFIPLGSKDRVVRGMTFRVYGPEGVPEDGGGHKASLTVIRTFKSISQCRVTTINKEDPVAIGDPFANIAFDPTRPPV